MLLSEINHHAATIHAQANMPKGMVAPGTLNLNGRPLIRNADGSVSSEYSFSFGDDNGREILIPTVVNGKFLTPDGTKPAKGSAAEKQMYQLAKQHYEQTGEHLGMFDNPDDADTYAAKVHSRQTNPTSTAPLYTLTDNGTPQ
jgi:hypothetical protein